MADVPKILSLYGIIFLILSLAFNILPRWKKVPGDIYLDKIGIRIYIPWLSSLIVSILITVIFNYFRN